MSQAQRDSYMHAREEYERERMLIAIQDRAQEREREERRQQPMTDPNAAPPDWHAQAAEQRAAELDGLCIVLRKHGVTRARVNGYELEFGAPPVSEAPPSAPERKLDEPRDADGLTKAEQDELYASAKG